MPQDGQKKETKTDPIVVVSAHQIKALRCCINKAIEKDTIKLNHNKIGACIVNPVIIIFSVASPIFIGWTTENKYDLELLRNLALVCSAITAGSTMFYNFFDYKDLWVRYKVSTFELESLLCELDYLEAAGIANIEQAELDELFEKYQTICKETNKMYKKIRLENDEEVEDKTPKKDSKKKNK